MTGVTFAIFKVSGKIPVSNDKFTNLDNHIEKNCFKKNGRYAKGACNPFNVYFINQLINFSWTNRSKIECRTIRIDITLSILVTFVELKVEITFLSRNFLLHIPSLYSFRYATFTILSN